jgi:hypothetical protein
MHIDRALADRYLAFLGFALSFLFLLAVVAFSFTVNSNLNDAPHIAQTISKYPHLELECVSPPSDARAASERMVLFRVTKSYFQGRGGTPERSRP